MDEGLDKGKNDEDKKRKTNEKTEHKIKERREGKN